MSTPVPSAKFATLTGSSLVFAPGTIDANALVGSATLTARRSSVAVASASPSPAIVVLPVTVCQLVNGSFSGVKLLGGNIPDSDFTGWTWHIEFNVKTSQGITVEIEGFDFVALAGETMDIASLKRSKPSVGILTPPAATVPPVTSLVLATPTEPYWSEADGTMNDSVYINDIVGITWLLNGAPVLPGTTYVTGFATVTPVADAGYRLPDGQQPYTHTFSTASATRVNTAAITFVQTDTEKSYTIPVPPTGCQYTDSMGNVLSAGTYTVTGGTYQFYAQALPGYALDGQTYWQRNFDLLLAVPNVSFDDVAKTFTVDAVTGVTYYNGTGQFAPVMTPGTYNAVDYGNSVNIVARADSGYQILSEQQSQFSFYFTV